METALVRVMRAHGRAMARRLPQSRCSQGGWRLEVLLDVVFWTRATGAITVMSWATGSRSVPFCGLKAGRGRHISCFHCERRDLIESSKQLAAHVPSVLDEICCWGVIRVYVYVIDRLVMIECYGAFLP